VAGKEEAMKIKIDWDLCECHGQCEFSAPNVFRIDNDDVLEFDENPPESERRNVEQAIKRCPTMALRLEG
jgi:ferredoxin